MSALTFARKPAAKAGSAGVRRAAKYAAESDRTEMDATEASPSPEIHAGRPWSFADIPVFPTGERPSQKRTASSAPLAIQTKLRVGATDDPLEHEADRVADEVIRTPFPETTANGKISHASPQSQAGDHTASNRGAMVQRQCSCGGMCDKCKSERPHDEEGKLQRKAAAPRISSPGFSPTSSGMTASPIVHEALRSAGQPLDPATRAFMEPRFGYDFGSVRLHTGSVARSSAEDLGALAYTVGGHIVLRDESPSRALLAHELTHVVQQAAAPAPLVQREPDGGQGPRKFFDLSRGALTGRERSKLLEVRRGFRLPDTPTPSDTSIVGVLVTETGEELPFHSGEFGGYQGGVRPADVKRGPGSGTNRFNRTHVETLAIAAMRKLGLKKAVLLIELEPCSVCGGYGKGSPDVDTKVPGVSAQLPEGAQLIVADTKSATYFRHAPTDPQEPTRAPKKQKQPGKRAKAEPERKPPKEPAEAKPRAEAPKEARPKSVAPGVPAEATPPTPGAKEPTRAKLERGVPKEPVRVAPQKGAPRASVGTEPQAPEFEPGGRPGRDAAVPRGGGPFEALNKLTAILWVLDMVRIVLGSGTGKEKAIAISKSVAIGTLTGAALEKLVGSELAGPVGFLLSLLEIRSDNEPLNREREINELIDKQTDELLEHISNWRDSHPPPAENPWGVHSRAEARQYVIDKLVAEQEEKLNEAKRKAQEEADEEEARRQDAMHPESPGAAEYLGDPFPL